MERDVTSVTGSTKYDCCGECDTNTGCGCPDLCGMDNCDRTGEAMTDQPVSGSDPEKAALAAILTARLKDTPQFQHDRPTAKWLANWIVSDPALGTDYTLIRRSELAALRDVAEAAREASKQYGSSKGRIVPPMEVLGRVLLLVSETTAVDGEKPLPSV